MFDNMHEDDIRAAYDYVRVMRTAPKRMLVALMGYTGPEKKYLVDLFFSTANNARSILINARHAALADGLSTEWIEVGLKCKNDWDVAVMALMDFCATKATLEPKMIWRNIK
jgi:hypothetical protein